MEKIRCIKCGTENTLVVDFSKAIGASLTLNCGTCCNILLTLQNDYKTNSDIKNGFTGRKLSTPVINFLRTRLKRKAGMFKFLIFATFALYCLSTLDLIDFGRDKNNQTDSTVSSTQKLASPTTKAMPVNHTRSAFYSFSKDQRKVVQLVLKEAYQYTGTIDGLWGPATQAAYGRLRRSEPQNVKGISHSQVFTNIINNYVQRQNAPAQSVNNLLGAYITSKSLGGGWFNPNTGQQVDPAKGWRPIQNGNELKGYRCGGVRTILSRQHRSNNGSTLCTYQNGTTINIGVGICPLTCD